MKHTTWVILAFALMGSERQVRADLIDFRSLPSGGYSSVTTAGDQVTFSLLGGPASGTPYNLSSFYGGLTNAPQPGYPTAAILQFSFAIPVSSVSFYFNNQGKTSSFVQALDSHGTLLQQVDVGSYQGSTSIGLTASSISELQFNNNTGGRSNWIFSVPSISFTPMTPVPEPSTLALFGVCGLCSLGYLWRRQRRAA